MLVATFAVPPGALALEQTLADHPHIEIEAERIAAHSTEWTMPCFWVAGDDLDSVGTALSNDPSVEAVVDTFEFGDERFYHLDWSDAVIERINTYTDKEGSILKASASTSGWEVTFRFVSREQFDEFRETVAEQGHDFELLELYEPGAPHVGRSGVTPAQRNALVTAHDRGYYEVPRRISSRELAAELDISHQSLSELLRRGTEQLIQGTLRTTGEVE